MTVSLWRRGRTLERVETDVAVVGAGITGLSAALELDRAGIGRVVLERHEIGSGASSRNAGFLMRGLAENYLLASEQFGRERAREIWAWTEGNLAGLRAEGIESLESYRAVPSCLVACEAKEADQLARSLDMLREDGFEAGWIEAGEDSLWRSGLATRGLVNPNDAACDPWELVRWLRSKISARVVEGAEVASIRPTDSGLVELIGPGIVTRARRVLVCVNAYASLLCEALAGVVEPKRGQMLALHAPDARLDHSYYMNWGGEYFRQTPDGSIVVGGMRERRAAEETGFEDRVTPELQEAIEGLASRLFGPACEVSARWSGTMGFSPDGMPLVGPVPGDWPANAVWFCGGFTGHGMSMAFKTAGAAVRAMIEGGETPFPLARALLK